MASDSIGGLVVVFALSVVLAPCVSAGDDCQAYQNIPSQKCYLRFCCGSCLNRYCCSNSLSRFTEDAQEDCDFIYSSHFTPLPMILGIGSCVVILLIFICCCVCPCCCLYQMCRKPRPVVATSTHTTVVTTTPQQYPRQPTATPAQPQSYQGGQYPVYPPQPVQSGYGAQPVPHGYGAQPMPQGYGAQPMPQGYGGQLMAPYPGQAVVAGPPPTYQEATGPGFPPNPMLYSQAAYSPGQPAYPLQPPGQPQPQGPNSHKDYLAQPAYNPDFTG
ncbi:uncharacterized protein LOC120834890 [Gasterosteus aculeatus]|uniref:Shisa N-terminal domain-containing protein n=2 Tax=Gasterosteus aculeatus aculeatus TaxID=481459 RepID=A0AAQ4QBG3_GASAC